MNRTASHAENRNRPRMMAGAGFVRGRSFLWILLTFAAFANTVTQTWSQAFLTTVLTNGPISNRINIVVLSEGYQTNQLGQFLVDATNAVNNLLSAPPFQEYRSYFNAFAISISSTQSGSDHPFSSLYRNTYFNSSYDSYGNAALITIPPNDRDANYANGRGKIDTLLQTFMPKHDITLLLVNDIQSGGSGTSPDEVDPILIATSRHFDSPEIVAHETGHAFAGLADEYTDAYPGYVPTERPNATTQTIRGLIKWNSWIDTNTPLPTPAIPQYAQAIGLFEGAEYQTNGWYRPKQNCKMRTLGVSFCEVCSEALVKSLYAMNRLRAIDSFSPASTNLSVTSTQAITFTVTPLQPMTHSLKVQWFTNGVAVSNATNTNFIFLTQFFANGTNIVTSRLQDGTPLVRSDPLNILSATATWTLSVNITELRLLSPQWLPSAARFSCIVTGTAPKGFVIQASTNLSNWVSLSTNTLVNGQFSFTNQVGNSFAQRFYRAMAAP